MSASVNPPGNLDIYLLHFLLIFILKMGIIYINLCGNLQVYTIFSNKLKIFSVSGQTSSRYLSNNNFSIEKVIRWGKIFSDA